MKKEELLKILQEKSIPDYYYNIDTIGEIDQRVCFNTAFVLAIIFFSLKIAHVAQPNHMM